MNPIPIRYKHGQNHYGPESNRNRKTKDMEPNAV